MEKATSAEAAKLIAEDVANKMRIRANALEKEQDRLSKVKDALDSGLQTLESKMSTEIIEHQQRLEELAAKYDNQRKSLEEQMANLKSENERQAAEAKSKLSIAIRENAEKAAKEFANENEMLLVKEREYQSQLNDLKTLQSEFEAKVEANAAQIREEYERSLKHEQEKMANEIKLARLELENKTNVENSSLKTKVESLQDALEMRKSEIASLKEELNSTRETHRQMAEAYGKNSQTFNLGSNDRSNR